MIPILFPTPVIAAYSLNMAVFLRANPDLFPSGGNCKPLDSPEGCLIPDLPAIRSVVLESLASEESGDSGAGIGDVTEIRRLSQGCSGNRGV
jgi:hypothetical protein